MKLALGTVQLGVPYGAANRTGQPTEADAIALIHAALAAGISRLDTARAYGDAERVVGLALRGASSHPALTTKLHPLDHLTVDTPAQAVEAAVRESVETSLALLTPAAPPTVLLHRPEHITAFGGIIWRTLLALRDAGHIQAVGTSVYTPQEALLALQNPEVRFIQLPFNVLDWRWHTAGLPEAALARPEVHLQARSILLQGILAAGAEVWPVMAGMDAVEIITQLESIVTGLHRQSRADLCIAYAQAQPWLHSIVVGMETPEQLHHNVALFQQPPLSEEACLTLSQIFSATPKRLLNPGLW